MRYKIYNITQYVTTPLAEGEKTRKSLPGLRFIISWGRHCCGSLARWKKLCQWSSLEIRSLGGQRKLFAGGCPTRDTLVQKHQGRCWRRLQGLCTGESGGTSGVWSYPCCRSWTVREQRALQSLDLGDPPLLQLPEAENTWRKCPCLRGVRSKDSGTRKQTLLLQHLFRALYRQSLIPCLPAKGTQL